MDFFQWWDDLRQDLEAELQAGLNQGLQLVNEVIEQNLLPLIQIPEPAAPWQRLYFYQAGIDTLQLGQDWPIDAGAWRITTYWPQTIPLLELPERYLWLEVPSMRQGDQLILCRAWGKAIENSVPPKLALSHSQAWGWTWSHFQEFSADDQWHLYEVVFHLPASNQEQEPGLIKASLEFSAPGQAWLQHLELLQAPAKLRPISDLLSQ